MNDEQQRAQHWAETHGHSHKQVHAQRQHVLEEQQHNAGQGGHAAPGDHPHGGAPQAKLYDKNLLPAMAAAAELSRVVSAGTQSALLALEDELGQLECDVQRYVLGLGASACCCGPLCSACMLVAPHAPVCAGCAMRSRQTRGPAMGRRRTVTTTSMSSASTFTKNPLPAS